jgi:RHS repeat-associated protein
VRVGDHSNCTYFGPGTTNKTQALASLDTALILHWPIAVETWLYNNGTDWNHTLLTTKHWLYQLTIKNNILGVDIYPMTDNTSTTVAVFNPTSRHYRVTIPGTLLPLTSWTHVVLQSPIGVTGSTVPEIWLNGVQLTVMASGSPLGQFTLKALTGGGIQYPDSTGMLKHLRIYWRLMSGSEIWNNAHNNCLNPSLLTYHTWYRFNIPNPGAPTTIAATSTVETRLTPVYPNHALRTTYAYNSTNQVLQQKSPDGGTNRFWYDFLSRLVFSQNVKQRPDSSYSYTLHDALGRITEVGQLNHDSWSLLIAQPGYVSDIDWATVITNGTRTQITNTFYDTQPAATGGIHALPQNNLRKRVVLSTYRDNAADTIKHATYYNYDLDGNVKTLYQQIAGLGIKEIGYEYDLISGKVNFVRYQDGKPDQYYYQYQYDADNKLTDAWSGIKALVDSTGGSELLADFKKQDAHYQYYLHGPLARVELGDQYAKVQGIDYAYTLQGWLKGVNGQFLNPNNEIGQDGKSGTNNNNISRDAYGYSLGYYNGDYKPIKDTVTAFAMHYGAATGDITGQSLYNGNISNTTVAISALNNGNLVGYTYHYDQLNRLKQTRQHQLTSTAFDRSSIIQDYAESLTYDGNGNILTLNRHGNQTSGIAMDSLRYGYDFDPATGKLKNNRLRQVKDAVPDVNGYTADLKNQADSNYNYDAIGNLVHDTQAGINNINWTVYGKIDSIAKTGGSIKYTYSPSGQRVSKTVAGLSTYYVRDAQGNTLALYDNAGSHSNWREQHLYGSSRLGMWTPNVNLATTNASMVYDTVGRTFFELNNHLANVLVTITDKRVQVGHDTIVDHYQSDVAFAQDYYAFGSLENGRQFTANTTTYRYGFNGKENDNEVKGEGNQQDYGARSYDPGVGRLLSLDPYAPKYPWLTPYQFASNNPVKFIDLNGKQADEINAEPEETREELERDKEEEELHKALKHTPEEEKERNYRESENWFRRNRGRLREALKDLNDNLVENTENALGSQTASFRRQFEQFNANKANGQALENAVTQALVKRYNAGQVAKQVTLQVSGTLNGENVTVRIRIDNVTNRGGVIDLHEAKYSIEQITGQNFNRTLTGNQQKAFTIFTQGTNVSILVRGNNGRDAELYSGDNLMINANTVNFNVVTNGQNGQPQTVSSTPIKQ